MRLKVILAIILAAAVVSALYFYNDQQAVPTGQSTINDTGTGPADNAVEQITPAVAPQPAVNSQYAGGPRLDDDPEARTAKATALFEQAEAGSAAAQYALAELLQTCVRLLDDSFPYRLENLREEGRPDWYIEKLSQDAAACSELPLDSLSSMQPAYWMGRAKEGDDPAAMAEFLSLVTDLRDLSGTDAIAAKVLAAKNGAAYYKLIPYLVYRDKHMGVYDEAYDVARNAAMIRLACHYGYRECEPGSRAVHELCVNAVPMCFPDMGMLEYLQRFVWTSEEARLYDVLFDQYLQVIEQGNAAAIFADS